MPSGTVSNIRCRTSSRKVPVPVAKSRTVTRFLSANPLSYAEGVFQDVMHCPDNEVHHRRRSVIHATAFTGVLVIGIQKVFVEIDIRIFGEQQPLVFGPGQTAGPAAW